MYEVDIVKFTLVIASPVSALTRNRIQYYMIPRDNLSVCGVIQPERYAYLADIRHSGLREAYEVRDISVSHWTADRIFRLSE
jgi:hypothetical protein